MAYQQLNYKYFPASNKDSSLGSCFVTVVVSPDTTGEISFEGYQMTRQCMDLAENDILRPTKDSPELATMRDKKSDDDFIPEIWYFI